MLKQIKLIIIGANNPTIIELVKNCSRNHENKIDIIGFLDNDIKLHNKSFYGYDILGPFGAIENLDVSEYKFINTIASSTKSRRDTTQFFLDKKAKFLSLVDPSVSTFGLTIGQGTIIYKESMIQPYVKIGDHCVISSCSGIAHETIIGNYVFVGPASYVCGKVQINDEAFIGTGAKILPNLCVSKGTNIAAGAIVINNTENYDRIMGVPGRSI